MHSWSQQLVSLRAHYVHEGEHRGSTYEDLSDDAGLAEGPEDKDEQAGGDDDDGRLQDEEREGELQRVNPCQMPLVVIIMGE